MSVSAISQLPFEAFEMTLTATIPPTGTEVPTPPYSNTWQIQVTNKNAVGGNNVLVQMQDLGIGAALPATVAAPTNANSQQVLPQETVTLTIGSEGNRHQIRTLAEWTAEPGANIVLVLGMALGNARPTITYVQNIGGGGQIRTGNP